LNFINSERPDDPFSKESDLAPNEAKITITLTREEEGIDGYIETDEGVEFDPGDIEDFPGGDVLRLAAEMVLAAAGYDEKHVEEFLDSAPRGAVQLFEPEE